METERDTLYFHFANLALAFLGLFSVQSIFSSFVLMVLLPGTIVGFISSWYIRNKKIHHLDTFIGALSLAAVVIILGRLSDTAISVDNLLKIFSTALAWLTLFQSFGLKTGKSYAILQFIAVVLIISSVGLGLEKEGFYSILLSLFLFIFIFTMRLSLLCEKKRKGSNIIGDPQEIMSLWQQIKVASLMFSFVLIVSSFVYPLVPRFENISFRWIPSSLLGRPRDVPLLKIFDKANISLKDSPKAKKEQYVEDDSKKREAQCRDEQPFSASKQEQDIKRKVEQKETTKRISAKKFDSHIDIPSIESLSISSDKNKFPLDSHCTITAALKMTDGSIIPAMALVDWTVKGTANVNIDANGKLTSKNAGYIQISASYMGNFSNDVDITITEPSKPIKKNWLFKIILILIILMLLFAIYLAIRVILKGRRLSSLASENPRDFINEIYTVLCRGFKFYGTPKENFIAHREFFEIIKSLISLKPEPMRLLTESVLEARFSKHDILPEHSFNALTLFHEVKDTVLQREEREFLKKTMFKLALLDALLVQR